jgi:hypothetical protein
MRKLGAIVALGAALVLGAACTHSDTPVNEPQLPPEPGAGSDGSAAGSASAGSGSAVEAAKPPMPPAPPAKVAHDAKISASEAKVKLVSAGTGKKQKLAIVGAVGAKTPVDITIGVGVKQGPQDQTLPAIVLHGDAEVSTADKTQAAYRIAVSGVEAKDIAGESRPPNFDKTVANLIGLAISGTVNANGSIGDVALHHDAVDPTGIELIEEVVVPGYLPMWPVLPAEAVGAGAKWQVTATRLLREKLAFEVTTDYELVSVSAKGFEVKGTVSLAGKEQDVDGAKVGQIGGGGAFTCKIDNGMFGVTHAELKIDFTATVPTGPNGQTQSVPFEFRFSTDSAPRQ